MLFALTGRRVARLKPGDNDIGHLSPGVCFRREKPDTRTTTVVAVR
jgi:hypothetical protein